MNSQGPSNEGLIAFNDLCALLQNLGFEMRVRESHYIFRREGVEEKVNLQRGNSKANPCQARQVRSLILRYGLGEIEDA